MSVHITEHRDGFKAGFTPITRFDEPDDNTGIAFGVLKLRAGQTHTTTAATETAWLLMHGEVEVDIAGGPHASLRRHSLFDESPSCVHVAKGARVSLHCNTDVELTVYQCANDKPFEARLYQPQDVPNEHRGKGQMGDTCHRLVRTIFDRSRADNNAELVLGEVVTLPGRWSSYPPHHHDQPEIYHYRFTRHQGYGHAELGETVLKVRPYDTVKIFAPNDHAQCAAPGYAMYYAWVIRHLPDNPYTVPTFTAEHTWTLQPEAPFWHPKEPAQ